MKYLLLQKKDQIFPHTEHDKKIFLKLPCFTLHKWLEANQTGFNKNKSNQLQVDLFVIDEMSMVDLDLMNALLDALPFRTQLILVGDPNQLPPVKNGAIWDFLQDKTKKNKFMQLIHLFFILKH